MAILNEAHGARSAVNNFFKTANDWLKANGGSENYKTNDDVLNGLMHMYNDRYTKSTGELTNPEGLTTDRISRILGIPKGDEAYSSEAFNNTVEKRLDYWHQAIKRGDAANDKRIADYFERPFDAPKEDVKFIDAAANKVAEEVPIPEPTSIDDGPSTNVVKPKRPQTEEKPVVKEPEKPVATEPTETETETETVSDTGDTGVETPAPDTNWWAIFGSKEFLTIAGVVTIVAGIIAAIRALSRSIKGRFQKYCKMLFRMQRDFNTKETGLDMTSIAGDKGNIFTKWFKADNWARWIFGDGKIDRNTQIGVRPFVKMYQDEIAADYQQAVKAFNAVATAGKGTKEASSEGFVSFSEAMKAEYLNESADASIDSSVNESVLLTMGLSMLTGAAVRTFMKNITASPGTYTYKTKDKDGKEKLVPVQVTKASTREVCLAIIGQFLDKYVNNESVFRKMGMDVDRLQDVSSSSYEKFKKVLASFRGGRDNYSSNQYQFVKRGWDGMIKNYDEAGQRIIKNFRKYTLQNNKGETRNLSEKDANNLEVAEMKIKTAWDLGINKLKGNFAYIVTAITSSNEYIAYFDFIMEKVLPVFKTGLAGDADDILNVYPKEGDYYIIRQTSGQPTMDPLDQKAEKNNQSFWDKLGTKKDKSTVKIYDEEPETDDKNDEDDNTEKDNDKLDASTFTGAAAICKVVKFNSSDKQITIKLLTAIGGDIIRKSDGTVDVSKMTYETDKEKRIYDFREETLEYNKWSSLDPMLVEAKDLPEDVKYEPGQEEGPDEPEGPENDDNVRYITPIFTRKYKYTNNDNQEEEGDEFIFGVDYDENESRSIDREKTYTEDTALYDSAINEADSSTGSDSSISSNDSNDNRQRLIREIIIVLQTADRATSASAIKLVSACDMDEFKDALQGFTEVKDEETISFVKKTADVKVKYSKHNVKIDNILGFADALEKIEKYVPASIAIKGAIPKIAENFVGALSKLQNIKDYKNKSVWKPFMKLADGNVYFAYILGNNQTSLSQKVKVGNTDVDFRIWLVYLATPQKDASTNTVQYNPTTMQLKTYSGNVKAPEFWKSKDFQNIFPQLPSINLDLQNPSLDGVQDKLTEEMTKMIQSLKDSQVITDSVKISYSLNDNIDESIITKSVINITRNIDKGKLKESERYFILSEYGWSDGEIENINEALAANMNSYLKMKKDNINEAAKTSKTFSIKPFANNLTYKVRLPKNRFSLMSEGNLLYESIALVKFDKKGNIEESYNLGIHKIEL